MTLPSGPFVCKNIDVEAAQELLDVVILNLLSPEHNLIIDAGAVIAAALGEVIPVEVETDTKCECFETGDPDCLGGRSPTPLGTVEAERYRTEWQPVVSTNQSYSESGLVVEPGVSDKEQQ